jgi:hypothetical protein
MPISFVWKQRMRDHHDNKPQGEAMPQRWADVHGRLRRQPEVIPKALVNDLLQVELADLLGSEFLKPQLRCRIAGSVACLKRLPKQFCLVLRRCQLDIGHQFHRSNIETTGAKYQVSRFLSNQARAVVGASAWRFQVKVDVADRHPWSKAPTRYRHRSGRAVAISLAA